MLILMLKYGKVKGNELEKTLVMTNPDRKSLFTSNHFFS